MALPLVLARESGKYKAVPVAFWKAGLQNAEDLNDMGTSNGTSSGPTFLAVSSHRNRVRVGGA